MDEKKLGMASHQIADAFEFQAEFLEPCCWLVSVPARSLAEFLPQVLHHPVNQLFLVGKVIEEGSCIDARCFCDFLVPESFEALGSDEIHGNGDELPATIRCRQLLIGSNSLADFHADLNCPPFALLASIYTQRIP